VFSLSPSTNWAAIELGNFLNLAGFFNAALSEEINTFYI
jgi:hypothetical protein